VCTKFTRYWELLEQEPPLRSLNIKIAFRYSPPILKIYSSRYVYYRFSVLVVYIGINDICIVFTSNLKMNKCVAP